MVFGNINVNYLVVKKSYTHTIPLTQKVPKWTCLAVHDQFCGCAYWPGSTLAAETITSGYCRKPLVLKFPKIFEVFHIGHFISDTSIFHGTVFTIQEMPIISMKCNYNMPCPLEYKILLNRVNYWYFLKLRLSTQSDKLILLLFIDWQ